MNYNILCFYIQLRWFHLTQDLLTELIEGTKDEIKLIILIVNGSNS